MASAIELDTDYTSLDEDDVGLDDSSKKYTQTREEWLKMTKGQILRVAFVHFHTVDRNAVAVAKELAKSKGEQLTPTQMKAIGRKALEERAAQLETTIDKLTKAQALDLSETKFKQMLGHYQTGLGFILSRLKKDGPEADLVWKKLEEPKQYFTTLLLVYPTNQKGEITESEKQRLLTDWRLIPWRFSKPQFERVWKTNAGLKENNLSIANQDIKLECKDATYQNIAVDFTGPAIWQKNEKFRSVVLEAALARYDELQPFREMSTDQLRAKLGLTAPASSDIGTSDFDDMLSKV